MLNLHYIVHTNYEGLGTIQSWALNNGIELSRSNMKKNEPLPKLELIDALVIMGGPMSVNDEKIHPWLISEKKYIEKAIDNGKKVIGICLGAQLIANVLGKEVKKMDYEEIGWFKIHKTFDGEKSKYFDDFEKEETVFHWHGEYFELPDSAVLIAGSDVCQNQIFTYSNLVAGFQCHLEMNEAAIIKMLENSKLDENNGKFSMTETEIRNGFNHINRNNFLLNSFLNKFLNIK